jgi:aldehyde:ferredoxin oxidoreductase
MTNDTAAPQPLYGYRGKILRVDLTVGTVTAEDLPEEICRRYLGGNGFIAYFLRKEMPGGVDALGPENRLVIATGPVTGTPVLGSGRHAMGAKSPLTGGIALSQVGEFWGAELKRAGYDVVIIAGRSEKPVYLSITDGKAELRDAARLWGLETRETQAAVREELADARTRVLMIGPGGERLVSYACVMAGLYDAAGRGGLGAVMGSKNLKAVAVRGTGSVPVADPEKLAELRKRLAAIVDQIPVLKGWSEAGTGFDMDLGLLSGDVPVRNWRDGDFPGIKNITGTTLKETMGAGMDGCFACTIRCKKKARFDDAYGGVDPAYGGPEYETLGSLGSNLGIDDLKAIVKGNELCNASGIDTISAGGTIACCMEAWEKGLLTAERTGGLDMTWGNADAMLECLRLIVRREGLGEILSQGIGKVAAWLGPAAAAFAMHVKGLDPGQHEPRLMPSMGLGFMVNPHGADHCLNVHDTRFAYRAGMRGLEALGFHEPVPQDDIGPRKVALFRVEHLRQALIDCLSVCHLACAMVDLPAMVELVESVTGRPTGIMGLLRIGERAMTAARLFNLREGFSDEDDRLPPRFFEPKTSGVLSEKGLNPAAMERARRYYYRLMGWDERGVPLPERVEELYLD